MSHYHINEINVHIVRNASRLLDCLLFSDSLHRLLPIFYLHLPPVDVDYCPSRPLHSSTHFRCLSLGLCVQTHIYQLLADASASLRVPSICISVCLSVTNVTEILLSSRHVRHRVVDATDPSLSPSPPLPAQLYHHHQQQSIKHLNIHTYSES